MRIHEFLVEYDRQITLQKLGDSISEHDLAVLEQIDPTRNKQFVLWLVKQYQAKQFRLEDAVRVNEVLVNFAKLKNRLPIEQRDIGRFDFYKLDGLIDQLLNVSLEKDAPVGDTFPVVPGSKVLYNGPLGQLAIPETEEASCELGRGTKWCTASENNNYFRHYSNQGPLYIWRDKSGDKFQFHFESNQYMDARDQELSPDQVEQLQHSCPVIKKLFQLWEKKVTTDPKYKDYLLEFFKYIENPSIELQLAAVQQNGSAIQYIENPSEEVQLAAVQQNPHSIQYISNPSIEVQLAAVQRNGFVIAYIKNPSTEVQLAADVATGKWDQIDATPEEIEHYILHDISDKRSQGQTAASYASSRLLHRWPAAEPIIRANRSLWLKYVKCFPDAKITKSKAKKV